MTDTAVLNEILDRSRRIETRLTKYMEATGFDTKVRRPVWSDGRIIVPSPATSLKDVLLVIPEDWETVSVSVYHKDEKLLEVRKR